jgi:hypothetical protein
MIRSRSMRKSASTGFALAWKASIAFSPVAIKIVSRAFSRLLVRASIRAGYRGTPRAKPPGGRGELEEVKP